MNRPALTASESKPPSTNGDGQLLELPGAPCPALDRALRGRPVVTHAEFDLDEQLRYTVRYAVLTEDAVLYTAGHEQSRAVEVPIAQIANVDIDEALGVDRLVLRTKQGERHELPYSRRHRLEMNRLTARLKRRVEHEDDHDLILPPDADRQKEEDQTVAAPRRKVLLRLMQTARPYRNYVRGALALTMLSSLIAVVPAYLTKFIIDDAIRPITEGSSAEGRVDDLLLLCGLYALSIVLLMLSVWGRLRLLTHVGCRVAHDLREQVYSHMQKLSMSYFAKHRVGSLITRVTSDTDRLWDFIVFGSVDVIRHVFLMTAATALMLYTNWQLAVIGLLPVPVVAALTWWKTKLMTRMFGRLWTYWSRLTAVVGDAVPGVKVIKAFASEDREIARFEARNQAFSADEKAVLDVWTGLQPIVEGTMMLTRVVILFAGGWLIIQYPGGVNTIGTLVFFLTVVGFFHMSIMELAQKNRLVSRAATSAQRVYEVLDTPPQIMSKPDAVHPERMEGRVEFRNVSFSYDGTKPVLREVSLLAEPGQMIGLCGHSGAGKSTFVNLISRFYDVSDGQILIDGIDIRDYDLGWLRQNVGVVLQDPYLFHGTIAENIRYGRPDASLAEVVQAARAANAHDFISQLPDGYDTLVGERGQSVSGGERQRISIARAILHNPRVLILDEATSSVDTKTERQIQEALDRLAAGRTTFAIAHRLSTLANADQLIVLDKGRVVERGTHDELLARDDGHYKKLHKMQHDLAVLEAV